MSITEHAIRRAMTELRPKHGGSKDEYFTMLFLEEEYRLSRSEAISSVAFRFSSTGLNGFHYETKGRTLHLLACRWTAATDKLKDVLVPLLNGGLDAAMCLEGNAKAADTFLSSLQAVIDGKDAEISRVSLDIVFCGDIQEAEGSLVLTQLTEDLERKSYLVGGRFSHPVVFAIAYRSVMSREAGPRSEVTKVRSFPLSMVEGITREAPSGQMMRIGFVPLLDLLAMYRHLGQAFFERNIRAGLSDDEAPNRAISRALRRIVIDMAEEPEVFAFNHNGVTIYAELFVADGSEATVAEPRLLNGAQTVSTFSRFVNQFDGQLRSPLQKRALRSLQVMCKVITSARADFIVNVTVNNNRQNPVMPWSLHANDMIQLQIQDWLAKVAGVYYERQENAFSHLTREDLRELEIKEDADRAVKMLDLAKTFLAIEGDVERMSNMKEVFEREDIYSRVFNEERLKADPRYLLLCYKVHLRLGRAIQEILARGQNKYWYINRARNLVWSLLCQAILNAKNVHRRAELYGEELVVEADFTSWIAELASTRVRQLVGQAADSDRYHDALSQGRTNFLRSRSFFQSCMDLARVEYGWSHKKLK